MLDLGIRAELCLLSQSIADVWKSLSFFKNKSHLIQMNIRSIGQLYTHTITTKREPQGRHVSLILKHDSQKCLIFKFQPGLHLRDKYVESFMIYLNPESPLRPTETVGMVSEFASSCQRQ